MTRRSKSTSRSPKGGGPGLRPFAPSYDPPPADLTAAELEVWDWYMEQLGHLLAPTDYVAFRGLVDLTVDLHEAWCGRASRAHRHSLYRQLNPYVVRFGLAPVERSHFEYKMLRNKVKALAPGRGSGRKSAALLAAEAAEIQRTTRPGATSSATAEDEFEQ